MIVPMARVRIAGPRALLDATLAVVQDVGALHVARAPRTEPVPASDEAEPLARILADVEAALVALRASAAGWAKPAPPESLARARLFARRARRRAARIAASLTALDDERALLLRYQEFFAAFEPLHGRADAWRDGRAFYVVLRAGAAGAVERLRATLEEAVDGQLELLARSLASGETAVLVLVSNDVAPKVAGLLAAAHVQELPAPTSLGDPGKLRALPAIEARLAAVATERAELEARMRALREETAAPLAALRAWLHDRKLVLDARAQAHAGPHLFVLEGWLPKPEVTSLAARVRRDVGPDVLVETVATEPWSRADAPVALQNPPLFRPFEIVTRTLPLPRYGTIDPTPFVAVFFPMFFGIMLGDVGYGAVLAAVGLLLRFKSKPGTTLRSIASVAGACAAFSIVFGFVYGELFGDLGKRWLGMRPHGFDRESAIMPFLGLAGALGVVHVTLGIVLAVVNAWRRGDKREALGRGVAAVMVALTVLAVLAALEVLPRGLFSPLCVAVLVAFPILIFLEGVVAIVELVSNFGQILSYARIMALGTASLMLAIVANQMVGAMGSVLVGVVFALLFHVVNFAIGLFSPTIHALRLHYVEFFGRFFSPGGTPYEPLSHWHPSEQGS